MKVGGRRINSKKVKMNWTLNQKIKLPVDLKLDNDGELVEIEGAYVPELVSELEKQLKDAFQRADVSQDVLIREFVAEGKHDLVAACKEAFDAYRSLMNEKAANFKNEWITSLYKQYKDSLPKPISIPVVDITEVVPEASVAEFPQPGISGLKPGTSASQRGSSPLADITNSPLPDMTKIRIAPKRKRPRK